MENDLPELPEYRNSLEQLERARRTNQSGAEYWFAREIQEIFGYDSWAKFTPVIERASASMTASGSNPSHHIVQTGKMVEIGRGAKRVTDDFFLSRGACYLIAMNGDSSKSQIAAAQAYFASTTRAKEIADAQSEDEKRLELRQKVKESSKTVSSVAKTAGVASERQAVFHNARYQGLYGMSLQDVKHAKGIGPKEIMFDRMGALELSANDFQMNLAAESIRAENIRGEENAIRKNKQVAERVRKTMIDSGSLPPESLPTSEPIKEVEKRLKQRAKQLSKPPK